ncbi:Ig domain-containing protein [Variovorax saccharolyticus]|uniref:Ig domain-containing protein n=1 Tax=Variovorax saccharolyticus TaxID=3053516 RepID=UPI0025767383|nr:Ig domain-containing protein [Variovorax sp. J31P216]MDM0030341.1 Ig domain-containing protein [Variovorax sp. J31P216]
MDNQLILTVVSPPPLRAQLEISPFALVRTVVAPPGLYVGPLVYEAQGLPAGLRVAAETGVLSGRPEGPLDTEFTLVVRALLATPMLSGSSVVRVVARAELRLVGHSSWLTAQEGTPITPSRLASAAGGDEGGKLRFTVTPALPPGLTLDSESSVLSGTLAAGVESATRNYTLAVSDGRETAFAGFSLQTVARMGNAGSSLSPRPTEPPPLMLTAMKEIKLRVREVMPAMDARRRPVVGRGQEPLSYRLHGALPSGLSYVNGELTGSPDGTGRSYAKHVCRVDVTDATGQTQAAQFQLTVERDPTDGTSDEQSATWDEAAKLGDRIKGESASIDAQWAINGIVTKTAFNAFSATTTHIGAAISVNAATTNVTASATGAAFSQTLNAISNAVLITDYSRTMTQNFHGEFVQSHYKGDFRVTELDPPPLEVNITYAARGAMGLSNTNMDSRANWISLSEKSFDDLSRHATFGPETERHREFICSPAPPAMGAPIPKFDNVERRAHVKPLAEKGTSLEEAEALNATLRFETIEGQRTQWTVYSEYFRGFFWGDRMTVHKDHQRDVYLHTFALTTGHYSALIEGESVHHAQGLVKQGEQEVPTASQYTYENGLEMRIVEALGGHGREDKVRTLTRFSMVPVEQGSASGALEFHSEASILFASSDASATSAAQASFMHVKPGGSEADSDVHLQGARALCLSAGSSRMVLNGTGLDMESEKVSIVGAQVHIFGDLYQVPS